MIVPQKLRSGDEIRVIAPALSLSILSADKIDYAVAELQKLGLVVTFSHNAREMDDFSSSSITSRVDDIHDAFRDPHVKGILTVIGGFNSNQLLAHLDYDLIKNNPKILCGYSDITALATAITAKTGLITYSGMHFSTFSMHKETEYNIAYFKKCCMSDDPFFIDASQTWSDDAWFRNQEDRTILQNDGWWVIQEGEGSGMTIGGNLCTLNLLQGTSFMPDLTNTILFIEDDNAVDDFVAEFDRNLQSLIHQKDFSGVRGIVIGRMQIASKMTRDILTKILSSKKELAHLPIIANLDFGHTNPLFTFPIGGSVEICAASKNPSIRITQH